MANILLSVFSGHASGIFDTKLERAHNNHVEAKENGDSGRLDNIYIVETQWDNGGHTGFLLKFYKWLKKHPEFEKEMWKGFLFPPPMGDLKSQISRWHKFLIEEEHNNVAII